MMNEANPGITAHSDDTAHNGTPILSRLHQPEFRHIRATGLAPPLPLMPKVELLGDSLGATSRPKAAAALMLARCLP